jgi:hypothetical protein
MEEKAEPNIVSAFSLCNKENPAAFPWRIRAGSEAEIGAIYEFLE